MYGHPHFTPQQRALYMQGFIAMRRRHRRYVRVILPRLMAATAAAAAIGGAWLHALFT